MEYTRPYTASRDIYYCWPISFPDLGNDDCFPKFVEWGLIVDVLLIHIANIKILWQPILNVQVPLLWVFW